MYRRSCTLVCVLESCVFFPHRSSIENTLLVIESKEILAEGCKHFQMGNILALSLCDGEE